MTGQPTVYVKVADGFEPRPVKVKARTETQVVIEGIYVPSEVALINPSRAAGAERRFAYRSEPQAPRRAKPADGSTADLTPDVLLPVHRPQHRQPVAPKLRTLLTMSARSSAWRALSMPSIGAGAQQQVMAFIEGLGVAT